MHTAVTVSVVAITALASSSCAGVRDTDTDIRSIDQSLAATDFYFGKQQWHYNEANVPMAWNITTGSASTIIAVLDIGTMPHPDLDAKWISGYDFYAGDSNPHNEDLWAHMVHVAGTIAAVTNNGMGVAGVCWGCKLMPMRVAAVDSGDTNTPSIIAKAINSAIGQTVADGFGHTAPAPAHPASVINISVGNILATTCPTALQTALDNAWKANAIVVAAAGNQIQGHGLWVNCKHVIVVSAARENGLVEPYAVSGYGVTLAAPGGSAVNSDDGYGVLLGCAAPDPTDGRSTQGTHGVVSTWVTAQGNACYRHLSGTSMAAPHVSGIAALMKSRNPSLTAQDATAILTGTARPTCNGQCGAGLVDGAAAVSAALVSVTPSCESDGAGKFSCVLDDVTGLAPLNFQWSNGANATIPSPTSGASVTGHCSIGLSASVHITVTDSLGRSATANRSFMCTPVVN